jgi:thioredoxin-related protein
MLLAFKAFLLLFSFLNALDLRLFPNFENKKALVIAFLSAECPCSMAHEKYLSQYAAEFKDFEFIVYDANLSESAEQIKNHYAQFPITVIQDKQQKMANLLGALKTPHVFILDKKGQEIFNGGVTDTRSPDEKSRFYLKEALVAIQKGELPNPKQVRTLGCTIKR